MRLNILDAHDRLKELKKQDFDIGACCQDLINQRPFGDYPFYIFAHTRTDDDGVSKRMIWQPRLTKPKAESNSMLFKGYPGTDTIITYWILPPHEMWDQYEKGLLTENETVCNSIYDYKNNRAKLEKKEDDDLPDSKIDAIYRDLAYAAREKKVRAESAKVVDIFNHKGILRI